MPLFKNKFMKKIIILSLLLTISAISFSQPTTTAAPVLTKSDYLQKSKKQRTVAWFLLLGGFGLEVTAFAAAYETEFGTTLVRAGFLANLASIPFFIMARSNKKKGMRLSFKNESTPKLQKGSFVNQAVPSLNLKIHL